MANSTINPSTDDSPTGIIIIDNEPLSQDCLAEVMRGEFPQAVIVGVPTIHDLYRPNGIVVKAILLNVKSHPIQAQELARELGAIGRQFSKAPVILISTQDDAASIEAAVSAGAQGLIPVTASLRIAVAAMRLVLAGGTYYPRPIIDRMELSSGILEIAQEGTLSLSVSNLRRTHLHDGAVPIPQGEVSTSNHLSTTFTAREVDVLTALRQGWSNKWIAHHLNLSENTIKVHIRHIMRKLRATNRTEAVIRSQNLVDNPGGD